MNLLFLSHCVPNPPDKGEKIRAFHELNSLCRQHRVHLACFARSERELDDARRLADRCASVYVEALSPLRSLARAAVRFAAGRSLTASYHQSRRMRRHVESLRALPLDASIVYSTVVAPYAPPEIPMLLDFVDVDSEKWLQYAATRRWGPLYGMEGRRLRRLESRFAMASARAFLTTAQEAGILRGFCPAAPVTPMCNGVDFEYFDPYRSPRLPELAGRRFAAFLGAMDYYPNAEAACWFATEVMPEIRRADPDFEFLVVGRNPGGPVRRLAALPGVSVTGAVPDVRPYLAAAQALAAPLRIARGVQNKVLEALAMGKRVLASPQVCLSLGELLPPGIVRCAGTRDYLRAALQGAAPAGEAARIRASAERRFSWDVNLRILSDEISNMAHRTTRTVAAGMGEA